MFESRHLDQRSTKRKSFVDFYCNRLSDGMPIGIVLAWRQKSATVFQCLNANDDGSIYCLYLSFCFSIKNTDRRDAATVVSV